MMQLTPRMDWTTMNSDALARGRTAGLIAVGLLACFGCRSFTGANPQDLVSSPPAGVSPSSDAENPVVQASAESPAETVAESAKKTSSQIVNFVSGREQENVTRGRELYQEADSVFRTSQSQSREDAVSGYRKAAKLFRTCR